MWRNSYVVEKRIRHFRILKLWELFPLRKKLWSVCHFYICNEQHFFSYSNFSHFPFYQRFYNSNDEALNDIETKKIIAIIQFSHNFTESFLLFNDNYRYDDSDNGIIQVYLSSYDLHRSLYIKKKMYEAYESFLSKLMVSCGNSKKAGGIPIVFEAAFGELGFKYRRTLVSGVLLL